MLKRLILLLTFSLSHGALASNLISADDDFQHLPLGDRVYYLEDTEHQYTAESLAKTSDPLPWKKSQWQVPNFGFTDSAYWFWFQAENEGLTPVHWMLEVQYPLLDNIEVYMKTDEGQVFHWSTGDKVPFHRRPIDHRHFVFPFGLESLEHTDVFIRVESEGTLELPISLWHQDEFYRNQQSISLPHGIFIGLFLVVILYNFFLWLTIRESSYLYYVGFACSFLGFFFSLSGYGNQLIWSAFPLFQQYSVFFFIALSLFSLTQFTISFLKIFNSHSKAYHFLRSINFASVVNIVLALFLPYEIMIQILMITCIYSSFICIWVGVQSIKRHGKTAGLYTGAWAVLAGGMLLMAIEKMGFIAGNRLIEATMPVSAGIMSLMLSFALGYRIQEEQRNREQAEKSALKSQKEALKARLKANELAFQSEQVRVAAEAEGRAKNEFLAMMSHEIRTPLNGIMGMSDLLKSTELEPQQRRYVNTIYSSGESLLTIINDILDFSKILAGKLDVENVPVDLCELMDNCTSVFAQPCRDKQLTFTAMLTPAAPVFIQSDPVRLRQVILNYLSNAVKFTEEGDIDLMIDIDLKAEVLTIKVKDSGIGIDSEKQQSLFSAFSQADSSTTRKYGGTGLGLAICKKLAELMGGRVGITSKIGTGSTFEFCCKVDVIDTGESFAKDTQDIQFVTLCLPESDQRFIERHSELWHTSYEHLSEGDINSRLPTLNESTWVFTTQEFKHTLSQRFPSLNILSIGQFDETSDIRYPLSTSSLIKCFIQDNSQQQHAAQFSIQENDGHPLNGLHILVAEDNQVNQMVIKALLAKLGAEASIVENGEQALKAIENSNDYDLILMDCEMPIMDGFSATEAIRQLPSPKAKNIPIIALTAHAMEVHKKRALACGMNQFLSKPVKRGDLIQVVIDTYSQNLSI